MERKKLRFKSDGGWTFIEAIISIVIMSIMILGLTVVLMAFREHLDRSWSIRVMDQYGNDVVERLTHELRNAVDLSVRNGIGNTHRIDITYLDPYRHDVYLTNYWRADPRSAKVTVNNDPIDRTFPPTAPGRGESFEIAYFTLTQYGTSLLSNESEHQDMLDRNEKFLAATWDIRFKLRYNRRAVQPGERNWSYEKEYYNRVYIRNMNLAVKKGILD